MNTRPIFLISVNNSGLQRVAWEFIFLQLLACVTMLTPFYYISLKDFII
jgi:hypothetical protein